MSTASERVEIEALKNQIQHLRSELQPIETLRSELQAVHDAYPWDSGKGESASSKMKSAIQEAAYQKNRHDAPQKEHQRIIVKPNEALDALDDLRERYGNVLSEARRAGMYPSEYGSTSHYLFPYLAKALDDLDDLEEKQKKNTPTDQF